MASLSLASPRAFYKVEIRQNRLAEVVGYWANLSKEEPDFEVEYFGSALVNQLTNEEPLSVDSVQFHRCFIGFSSFFPFGMVLFSKFF